MMRMMTFLAFFACLLLTTPGNAQDSNQRDLATAREALDATSNLVADTVDTDMEMIDGDGKSMGAMRIREKISGWANGEPVRTIVTNSNPEHSAVANSRFKVFVDNHPEKGLRDGATLDRMDTEVYDGKPCAVYVVTGAGKVSFKSRVWIEKASGLPLKIAHDFYGIPMAKALVHTIIYGRSKDGAWLPVSAVVDATVGMLFQKMRFISTYHFLTWAKRPSMPQRPG